MYYLWHLVYLSHIAIAYGRYVIGVEAKCPRVLIFASGGRGEKEGGSGFQHLIWHALTGVLHMTVVGVVSNHANGGVHTIATHHGVNFFHFEYSRRKDSEYWQSIIDHFHADYYLLSGWMIKTIGLPTGRTLNIHPGCTKLVGGQGMYGHFVHEKTMELYREGLVNYSYVVMHLVDDVDYDHGVEVFRLPIVIEATDTADTLQARVNRYEHGWQWQVTALFVSGQIWWDGRRLHVPRWYRRQPYYPACTLDSTQGESA